MDHPDRTVRGDAIIDLLRERLEPPPADNVPPACFLSMGGEFLEYDPDAVRLTARFPVRGEWLNPYGIVQGGFVVAAADNTVGPLSILVAPPSVTRTLEASYHAPVRSDFGDITVVARVQTISGRRVVLTAEVLAPDGTVCTTVLASHTVLRDPPEGGF